MANDNTKEDEVKSPNVPDSEQGQPQPQPEPEEEQEEEEEEEEGSDEKDAA